MLYRLYVRPILEFGSILFSSYPFYKLRPLITLERQALRLCLGLPKYVPIRVLYWEARILPLIPRFKVLTVEAYLRVMELPISRSQMVFVHSPSSFFAQPWPRYKRPQVVFVQSLLAPLNINILSIPSFEPRNAMVEIDFDNIFPSNSKYLPEKTISGLLITHLEKFPTHVVVATDASKERLVLVSFTCTRLGIFFAATQFHNNILGRIFGDCPCY